MIANSVETVRPSGCTGGPRQILQYQYVLIIDTKINTGICWNIHGKSPFQIQSATFCVYFGAPYFTYYFSSRYIRKIQERPAGPKGPAGRCFLFSPLLRKGRIFLTCPASDGSSSGSGQPGPGSQYPEAPECCSPCRRSGPHGRPSGWHPQRRH